MKKQYVITLLFILIASNFIVAQFSKGHPLISPILGIHSIINKDTVAQSFDVISLTNGVFTALSYNYNNNILLRKELSINSDLNFDEEYIVTTDFDKDGDLDYLYWHEDQNEFLLLENEQSINKFSIKSVYKDASIRNPLIKVGDIDQNGLMDILITSDEDFKIGIVFQTSQNVFELSKTNITSFDDDNFELLDSDFDGDLDIVFENTQGRINILNNNNQDIENWTQIEFPTYIDKPLIPIHLNDDNLIDFISASYDGIFSYLTDPVTLEFEKVGLFAGSYNASNLLVKDINNDFREDIIFATSNYTTSNFIAVLLNKSSEEEVAFESYIINEYIFDSKPPSFFAYDVNNDKIQDIFYSIGNGETFILEGEENSFKDPSPFNPGIFNSFKFYDLDSDGDKDVIGTGNESIHLIENIGNNRKPLYNARPIKSYNVRSIAPQEYQNSLFILGDLEIDDLNADGLIDVHISLRTNGNANTKSGKDIILLNHIEEFEFNSQLISFEEQSNSFNYYHFTDVDGDQKKDLITHNSLTLRLERRIQENNFMFASSEILVNELIKCNYINSQDLDTDGDQDVYFTDNSDLRWIINENLGSGTSHKVETGEYSSARPFKFADLDRDKDLDIVTTTYDKVQLYNNKGDFEFLEKNSYKGSYNFDIIDFDGDHYLDVISGGYFLKNINNPIQVGFEKLDEIQFSTSSYTYGYEFVDLNHDESPDLVFKSINGLEVIYNYLNNPTFKGLVFFDENSNGILDSLERGLDGIKVTAINFLNEDTIQGYSITDGSYNLYTEPFSEYNLISETLDNWQVTTPDFEDIDSEQSRDTFYHFGYINTEEIFEVNSSISSPILRCNSPLSAKIVLTNEGTVIGNVLLELSYDTPLEYEGANISPIEIDLENNVIRWSIDSIYFFEKKEINVSFKPINVDHVGDDLVMNTNVIRQEDLTLVSSFQYNDILRCAYDPNDKLSFAKERDDRLESGEKLIYTIRFQNTGNDTAFNVSIVDVLDNALNNLEIIPLSGSHEYRVELNENIMTIKFPDILLPDSTTNLVGSQGFIQFEVKINDDVEPGYTIENRASIYFDHNPPILTNTVTDVLTIESGFYESNFSKKIILSPNPGFNIINIQLNEHLAQQLLNKGTLKIVNLSGGLVKEIKLTSDTFSISTDFLNSGVYFFQFISLDNVIIETEKFIKL